MAAMFTAEVSDELQSVRPEDALDRHHHNKNGSGFNNPWESCKELPVLQLIWALTSRKLLGRANTPDTSPAQRPTVIEPTFLATRTASPNLRATWLGHACYFVEFPSGLRVLFDPVFEDRCSPFSWLGPKRYTPAPCQVDNIPIIDAVIISHSHYDHLSQPTILMLAQTHPNAHFFVPLRLKDWFLDNDILPANRITEMDWWDSRTLTLTPTNPNTTIDTVPITATIHCLPSQHTSARGLFDRATTLWASWAVQSPTPSAVATAPNSSPAPSVYFGGDTGYRTIPRFFPVNPSSASPFDPSALDSLPTCPAFADIGRLRGPFTLALLPIGAYDPRWLFSPQHADPRDSVEIFLDIQARRAMGIHWGTWVLTEEEVMAPVRQLREVLKSKGLTNDQFGTCQIGESREFSDTDTDGNLVALPHTNESKSD